jgi:hypothetical protein
MVWRLLRPHASPQKPSTPKVERSPFTASVTYRSLKHNSLRGRGEITRTVRRSLAGSLRAERWLAAWLVESAGGLVRIGHLISRLR